MNTYRVEWRFPDPASGRQPCGWSVEPRAAAARATGLAILAGGECDLRIVLTEDGVDVGDCHPDRASLRAWDVATAVMPESTDVAACCGAEARSRSRATATRAMRRVLDWCMDSELIGPGEAGRLLRAFVHVVDPQNPTA